MLLADWLEIRGSSDPCWGLINLVEQVTELRKTLTYHYQFSKGDDKAR